MRERKNIHLAITMFMDRTLRPLGVRQCTQCAVIYWIGNFWQTNGKPCALCKPCANTRQNTWRKTYKDTNTVKLRARSKRWRERHPDLFRARIADWRRRNPDAQNEVARRRRTCRKYRVSKRDYQRLHQRQCGLCYICGMEYGPKPHIDHVFPIKRGGHHCIGNLLIACRPCNRNKSTKLLVEVRYRERSGKLAIY